VHPAPAALGRAYVGDMKPPVPLLVVPIQAVRVADDDGGREARVTPQQVANWVEFANHVYGPAGVRFEFEPNEGGFVLLRSSAINYINGTNQKNWAAMKAHADSISARYPGRLVIFFRWGPGARDTGQGFSWIDYDFVAMPGWEGASHCGHTHIDHLPHELGHHLGLAHTFAQPFPDLWDAATFMEEHGGVAAFDGDGLTDTLPDPSVHYTECDAVSQIELNGKAIELPRRNIMSYYDERDSLTPQQIARLRWFVMERQAHAMKLPKNAPGGAAQRWEIESLEVLEARGCVSGGQQMDGFGAGNWSGEAQIFCTDESPRARLAWKVATAGTYRVRLYATRAPDYGLLQTYIDDQPLGAVFDGWAPAVMASGPIDLGIVQLEGGAYTLTFDTVGQNLAAKGAHFGVDAIELIPEEVPTS
jgi:hypothetical protein